MKTSNLIAILAARLAEHGDQEVYLSSTTQSVLLGEVSDQDSFCIWLRTSEPERVPQITISKPMEALYETQ